jgi:hypothetical protein
MVLIIGTLHVFRDVSGNTYRMDGERIALRFAASAACHLLWSVERVLPDMKGEGEFAALALGTHAAQWTEEAIRDGGCVVQAGREEVDETEEPEVFGGRERVPPRGAKTAIVPGTVGPDGIELIQEAMGWHGATAGDK